MSNRKVLEDLLSEYDQVRGLTAPSQLFFANSNSTARYVTANNNLEGRCWYYRRPGDPKGYPLGRNFEEAKDALIEMIVELKDNNPNV